MDFEELIYTYKPRLWHFIFYPGLLIMCGWGLIHTSGILENWFCSEVAQCWEFEKNTYGLLADWIVAIMLFIVALILTAYMFVCGATAAVIKMEYEVTGENWSHERIHIIRNSRKWSLWAQQVMKGRPLAGRLWYGSGKLFSRSEYENRIRELWRLSVLDYTNGLDEEQGYIVRGAEGRHYIAEMAKGKSNLPRPLPRPASRDAQNMPIDNAHDNAHDEAEEVERWMQL